MSWNSVMSMLIFLKCYQRCPSCGYRASWPSSSGLQGRKSGSPCCLDSHTQIALDPWNNGRPRNAGRDVQGLGPSNGTWGRFGIHYQRKEEPFFPIMERYGHDSPPKVMWGVDKQIREPFQTALATAKSLPEVPISTVKEDFEAFETEFESMIFKEESILLMILLESSTQVRLPTRVLPLAMPSSVRLRNGCQSDRALLRKRVQGSPCS